MIGKEPTMLSHTLGVWTQVDTQGTAEIIGPGASHCSLRTLQVIIASLYSANTRENNE
jgi:hypothetical protein